MLDLGAGIVARHALRDATENGPTRTCLVGADASAKTAPLTYHDSARRGLSTSHLQDRVQPDERAGDHHRRISQSGVRHNLSGGQFSYLSTKPTASEQLSLLSLPAGSCCRIPSLAVDSQALIYRA
jgi:hypothetical protein